MKHNKIVALVRHYTSTVTLNLVMTSPVHHQEVISPNCIVCIQPIAIVLKLNYNYTSINKDALVCTMH